MAPWISLATFAFVGLVASGPSGLLVGGLAGFGFNLLVGRMVRRRQAGLLARVANRTVAESAAASSLMEAHHSRDLSGARLSAASGIMGFRDEEQMQNAVALTAMAGINHTQSRHHYAFLVGMYRQESVEQVARVIRSGQFHQFFGNASVEQAIQKAQEMENDPRAALRASTHSLTQPDDVRTTQSLYSFGKPIESTNDIAKALFGSAMTSVNAAEKFLAQMAAMCKRDLNLMQIEALCLTLVCARMAFSMHAYEEEELRTDVILQFDDIVRTFLANQPRIAGTLEQRRYSYLLTVVPGTAIAPAMGREFSKICGCPQYSTAIALGTTFVTAMMEASEELFSKQRMRLSYHG